MAVFILATLCKCAGCLSSTWMCVVPTSVTIIRLAGLSSPTLLPPGGCAGPIVPLPRKDLAAMYDSLRDTAGCRWTLLLRNGSLMGLHLQRRRTLVDARGIALIAVCDHECHSVTRRCPGCEHIVDSLLWRSSTCNCMLFSEQQGDRPKDALVQLSKSRAKSPMTGLSTGLVGHAFMPWDLGS